MSKTGIAANSERRTVSGVRVNFDKRTTAEVDSTRDMKSRKGPVSPKSRKDNK